MYIRYIQRFVESLGDRIRDISNISIKREELLSWKDSGSSLRRRVHPSLLLYTVVVGQTQVGVPFLPEAPLALRLWSRFIPKTI